MRILPVSADSSHCTMNGASSAAAKRSSSCDTAATEIPSTGPGGDEMRPESRLPPDGGLRTDDGARCEGGGPPADGGNPLGPRGTEGGEPPATEVGGPGGPPGGGGGSVGMKARRAMD